MGTVRYRPGVQVTFGYISCQMFPNKIEPYLEQPCRSACLQVITRPMHDVILFYSKTTFNATINIEHGVNLHLKQELACDRLHFITFYFCPK